MKNELMAAARGDIPLDFVIENVQLVNVFTGEIYPASIGIKDGWFVHVSEQEKMDFDADQRLDAQQMYAIPGLIDTHLHIESSMLTPAQYAQTVLPHGTTTIVTDPHEIANVLGVEGVRYMVEACKDLDLRVLTLAPSCIPSAPKVETSGADFTADVIRELLKWPEIDGVAEVMNYHGVIHEDQRMMGILKANEEVGKIAQGHAPRVSGNELSTYLIAGPDSDHECRTGDEALEKIRSGMTVEIRESSFSMNMAAIAEAIKELGYLPNVTLCSDDVLAVHLMERGHMDHVVRRAIEEGIEPIHAIRFATLNAANRLHRYDLGAIAPRRRADLVLLKDIQQVEVQDVFVEGKHVASRGMCLEQQSELAPPDHFLQTVRLNRFDESQFHMKVEDDVKEVSVRVIEYDAAPGIPTDFLETTLPVQDGEINFNAYQGKKAPLCQISVWHRHGLNQNHAEGLLAGFGIIAGAVATTVAHDSHHLAVLGVNPKDMAIAANHLREMNGGMIGVWNGEVIAKLALPLAGLMSLEPATRLGSQINQFIEKLNQTIMPGFNPIHRLIVATLPVIPRAKITDLGLVDVERQELVPFVIEA
ncbi:Adenine deaminase [Seinonella peptonophila]|uniref:Adenine deaminase n=1 Tax=Seinonella peptonophila TaxID=112248 RepID=A0A1M4TJ62_9BACL|nr:adenine deaminase [Seinonella peptonophila]SHE44364.1 Adenine deaminase [Seinonella peptonophila]